MPCDATDIVCQHHIMTSSIALSLCLLWVGGSAFAQAAREAAGAVAMDAAAYTGHDGHDIPRYATRSFTAGERALLRTVYGVEDPSRLYVSDSSGAAQLKYDTRRKRCRHCYVNSYRIGFASIRRPGESWEQVERRIASMRPSDFPRADRTEEASLDALDPAIRDAVARMLADASRAGFVLRVTATYRSPWREAYLMRTRRGSTHTLTSLHAYGRALDVVVGDGDLRRARTRAEWVAFRRWVSTYHGAEFRILGTPDRTWDWSHVEVPSPEIGFRSIDAILEHARECDDHGAVPCDFPTAHRPR